VTVGREFNSNVDVFVINRGKAAFKDCVYSVTDERSLVGEYV